MYSGDLDDLVRKAMNDNPAKDRHHVVKLPCCGSSVEVEGKHDQYVVCPNPSCMKRHVLLMSGFNPQIRSETNDDPLARNWR